MTVGCPRCLSLSFVFAYPAKSVASRWFRGFVISLLISVWFFAFDLQENVHTRGVGVLRRLKSVAYSYY